MKKKSYFSVEFPLKTEKWQEDILLKRFRIARQLYNELMTKTRKRHLEMKRIKAYREAYLIEDKKERSKVYNDLRKKYRLSEFDFKNDMTKLYKIYSHHIDSLTAGQIAKRVWQAHEDCLFKEGTWLKYKKELQSLTSGSNRSGITVRDQMVRWKGLQIPIQIKNKKYEKDAFENPIVANKVVYRNHKFYVQILFQNVPYLKERQPGVGSVGIFIKISNIYLATEKETYLLTLPEHREKTEYRIKDLQQRLERSRRATNPENYFPDGTIKKGRLNWTFSKKYQWLRKQLRDVYEKENGYLKQEYYKLTNEIIKMGNAFAVGKLDYAAMKQKENKSKRKKLQEYAPNRFLQMLQNKLSYYDNASFVFVPQELYQCENQAEDDYAVAQLCRDYIAAV